MSSSSRLHTPTRSLPSPFDPLKMKALKSVEMSVTTNTATQYPIPDAQYDSCSRVYALVPLSNTPVVGAWPHRYTCCALTATSQLLPLTPVRLSCYHTSCLMSGTVTFTGGCLRSAACFRPLLMPLWLLESWCLERAECKCSCHLCLYFVIVTTVSG